MVRHRQRYRPGMAALPLCFSSSLPIAWACCQ
jgi:hypothetical protein